MVVFYSMLAIVMDLLMNLEVDICLSQTSESFYTISCILENHRYRQLILSALNPTQDAVGAPLCESPTQKA